MSVASVALSDRLSDSGVIAVIIAERSGERLVVDELCISCRALGRQIEDSIVLLSLRDMAAFEGCSEVVFRAQHAARNQPALDWLARLLRAAERPGPGLHSLQARRLVEFQPNDGVTIIRQ